MKKRMQILVIVDPRLERSPALLRAMALARKADASLLLRLFEHARDLAQAAKHGFDLEAYLRGRRSRLEEFAGHLRREGFTVDCGVVWGAPRADRIIWETLALKPELVVKDVAGEAGTLRGVTSGLDWQLLRECPAPLMLVHPGTGNLPKRILAVVDPLDENDKPHELNDDIIETAAMLAMQSGADLDVAHAFEFTPLTVDPQFLTGWVPDPTLYQELRDLHAKTLYQLGRQHGVTPGRMHVLDGDPARVIPEFAASHKTSLVVMGSVYRTGLRRLLIGSTALALFDRLRCDVLALKPAGFATELAASLEPAKPKAA